MRKIRRCFLAALAVGVVLLFGACNDSEKNSSDKSLYEHGLEVITLMQELASNESYVDMYTVSDEIEEIVNSVAEGDYKEPKAVYQINIPDDKLLKILGIPDKEAEGMSDTIKDYLKSRSRNSIASIINRTGGTNIVIASAICSATKIFVSDEQVGDVVYLYTYDNAIPIFVIFKAGDNGAVSAYGDCILHKDFFTDTAEKIEQALQEYDIEVEEIRGN